MVDGRNRLRGQKRILYSDSHPPHTMMPPTTITFNALNGQDASQYKDNALLGSCKPMFCLLGSRRIVPISEQQRA